MTSRHIFNTDIISGNILWIDSVQSTGNVIEANCNLNVKDDLNVGKNTQLSGTLHVDQDAVLKSNMYLEDDLNVGKNTQLSGTLHVDQDAVLKSNMYLEDDLNVGKNTQLSGTLHVDQDAVLKSNMYLEDDLNVGKNTQLSGTLHVDQDAVLKSNMYLEDDLNVGKNTQLSGTLHVDQDATLNSDLFVKGDARIEGDLYVSGDQVIMETSTVRVEDKNIELAVLDSATDATADQGGITLKGTTDKTISWSNATDSWDVSEHLGVADGKYIFSDKLRARDSAGLSLEDDGGNGIFIEDGGNIGINTTSPSDKLDINGNLSLSNNSKIRWKDSLGNPKDTFRVDDQDQLLISNNTTGNGGNIIFRSKASFKESMAIDADGNVGIGTTSPSSLLHVDNNSFGDLLTLRTIDGANNPRLFIGTSSTGVYIRNSHSTGAGDIDFQNGLGGSKMLIKEDGRVGINTTSPEEKLAVSGNIFAFGSSPELYFGPSNNSRDISFTRAGVSELAIKRFNQGDGWNESMRIDSDGNVGIGTTSPGERLDVNGRIRIENSTAPTTTSNRLYAVGGNLFWNGEDVLHARDTIGEMEDTSIGTKSNGQLLIWNDTSSKWVNNTLTGGSAIDVTNAAGGITISHADTSTASSSSNSGRTYIQDIEIDGYGHVTSINTATETVVDTNTWRGIDDTPQDGATTTSISSNWAFDNVKTAVPENAIFTDTNTWRGIDDTPQDGATTTSISSNWAFDNVKTAVPANAVFTDTVPTFSYDSTTKTLTITT